MSGRRQFSCYFSVHLLVLVTLTFCTSLTTALENDQQAIPDAGHLQQGGSRTSVTPSPSAYKVGDPVPVTCLNRTTDTGEHVEDETTGQLQYIPFPTCLETKRPLAFAFGVERDMNCTIDFLSDELYHLIEFYIHNDAPLTCRIPSRPLPGSFKNLWDTKLFPLDGEESILYTPFTISLNGMLQLSHLHIANNINVLIHAAPRSIAPGTIDAATAYSVSPSDQTRAQLQKVIIGDSLPLHLSVRWYPDTRLPPVWKGIGGHFYISTLFYCLLSAGASAAICVSYFRGVELPRRLKSYGKDKLGASWRRVSWLGGKGRRGSNGGLVRYNGYGYGIGTGGSGNGFANGGKIE
ncbi:hypothetical protein NA57DRAFT_46975 [Rhizodiscina lignyota]|uniref:Uncharacterized protein n=1 Tax=Rhizodiscina lignyota TaxID=1504668 RepID=A0A9P4I8E1_9PEZI|nr:hypothetical protein NA57DRAFT_46975 [Rhizodiscina lignyota]